ncbi:MAG: hypothetical protein J1E28_07645 [Helicobacter sp.]|uniref:hypothetical protein n=1 Tax=Helicobacter sp. TaxID=218 RepID=UPI0025C4F28A|nr:hypothetical protein [Helicobacter sp.]MCH5314242.1 hypothetical protein [Helicobacter sp.]
MKYKALIVGVALSAQICMGNPVFAELFGDYVFYEGFPAGTYPDKNGNPLNYRGRPQGLVKINEGSKDEATLYEGNYNDGKKEGLFTLKSTVYEGVVFKEENYKDNQLNGEKKVWNFIPKANATAKEYHILVSKSLHQADAKPTERKKSDLKFSSWDKVGEKSTILRGPGCSSIELYKTDFTQGNEHSYGIGIRHKAADKWGFLPKDYDCSNQYGFFETLLEAFDKGEFKPFANSSDYQAELPVFEKDRYPMWSGSSVKAFDEKIIETINGATYTLRVETESRNFGDDRFLKLNFQKNGTSIDPRVYDQEAFNTLLHKMYDKEMVQFITENLEKL